MLKRQFAIDDSDDQLSSLPEDILKVDVQIINRIGEFRMFRRVDLRRSDGSDKIG
ncbi:hypothetical protein ES703_08081 [subsurface metagenome]